MRIQEAFKSVPVEHYIARLSEKINTESSSSTRKQLAIEKIRADLLSFCTDEELQARLSVSYSPFSVFHVDSITQYINFWVPCAQT